MEKDRIILLDKKFKEVKSNMDHINSMRAIENEANQCAKDRQRKYDNEYVERCQENRRYKRENQWYLDNF